MIQSQNIFFSYKKTQTSFLVCHVASVLKVISGELLPSGFYSALIPINSPNHNYLQILKFQFLGPLSKAEVAYYELSIFLLLIL